MPRETHSPRWHMFPSSPTSQTEEHGHFHGLVSGHELLSRHNLVISLLTPPSNPVAISENWESGFGMAVEQLSTILERRQHDSAVRLERLEREVEELKRKIWQGQPIVVPVTTLAPEPFDLTRDIPVASFFDANINASGCNETDAVDNLKALIVAFFKRLSAMPEKKLGPEPRKQLEVLKQFLRTRN